MILKHYVRGPDNSLVDETLVQYEGQQPRFQHCRIEPGADSGLATCVEGAPAAEAGKELKARFDVVWNLNP